MAAVILAQKGKTCQICQKPQSQDFLDVVRGLNRDSKQMYSLQRPLQND